MSRNYDSEIVTDSKNIALIGAPNGSAQEVLAIGDTTSLSVISYSLNTNDGQLLLTLNFDEPIQLPTLIMDNIPLSASSNVNAPCSHSAKQR